MGVAGGDFDRVFPPPTHKTLYNATGGVPHDLCVLCDAAMFNALALNRSAVDPECLDLALADLSFKGWRGQQAA